MPLLERLDQTVLLQRAQVVIHLLSREPDALRNRGSRPRRRQRRQDASPDGIQSQRRGFWLIDDVDLEHAGKLTLTTFLVNELLSEIGRQHAGPRAAQNLRRAALRRRLCARMGSVVARFLLARLFHGAGSTP